MHKLYINPLPVRIWHWTNAIGFVLLIATGLQIRYLDLIQLMSFKTAVVAHNWIGFVLIANFFVWLRLLSVHRQDQGLSPRVKPDEVFPRQLPANAVLWVRHLQGRSQSASCERLSQIQSLAEHDVPDHHDAARAHTVFHGRAALGCHALFVHGGHVWRRARRGYGARPAVHLVSADLSSSMSTWPASATRPRRISRQ